MTIDGVAARNKRTQMEYCIGEVEQLAGVELSKAFFDMPDPMFYDTVYLGKDPTRAASRILRRPWMCGDLRIKDVIGKVVRQRTSIMQRIRNSTVMKERFMKEVRMHDYAGNHSRHQIKNLSHALNRFNSNVRPLQRFVVFFSALVHTAIWIARSRTDDQGKDALSFIEFIAGDEGMEVCLLLAMMADAGACAVGLLRFFDRETFDIAQVSDRINTWAAEVKHLFVDKHADQIPESYTFMMFSRLRKPMTAVLKGQTH
ncbi:unnamed protein product [Prorocentrum cordatum]|uniref:Uncharacterized protein n=1 Tax=Prorocentrum cordatum TaxID=2364126 RepID=A0ABN9Q020_9DINO|nr:unnamed protein product [Polarella glacialis]